MNKESRHFVTDGEREAEERASTIRERLREPRGDGETVHEFVARLPASVQSVCALTTLLLLLPGFFVCLSSQSPSRTAFLDIGNMTSSHGTPLAGSGEKG